MPGKHVVRSPCVRRDGARAAWSLLVLTLVAAAPVAAAEMPELRALTPPVADGPVEVYLDLYGLRIYTIDEIEQTFEVGARMSAVWWDERLAFGPETTEEELVFQGEAAVDQLDKRIWWPAFEIVDSRGPRTRLHVELRVRADGWARYEERFVATIAQPLDLVDFPFDAHDIELTLAPIGYDGSRVVFVPPETPRDPVDWEPTEWYLSEPELIIGDGTFAVCSDSGLPCDEGGGCPDGATCETGTGFSTATVALSIARVSNHYVWKILVPLVLIILISSAVYWMDLERFPDPGDRFTVAFTAVLTVVAFDFVTADSLPKLWYTTVMDRLLLLGYVFTALNVVGIAVTTALSKHSLDRASRLVRLLRWLFPGAFLLTVLVLILGSFLLG